MKAYVHRLYRQTLAQSPVCLMSAHWMRAELDELRKNRRKMKPKTPYEQLAGLQRENDALRQAAAKLARQWAERSVDDRWHPMHRNATHYCLLEIIGAFDLPLPESEQDRMTAEHEAEIAASEAESAAEIAEERRWDQAYTQHYGEETWDTARFPLPGEAEKIIREGKP